MKKIIYIVGVALLAISCIKKETTDYDQNSFKYNTTKEVMSPVLEQARSANTHADIIDQDGKIIASNLTTSMPLTVESSAILRAVPSAEDGDTFSIFFPSKTEFATMMFEDLFPSKGDYDMNDAVIGFRYELISKWDSDLEQFMVNKIKVVINPKATGSASSKDQEVTPIRLALAINGQSVVIDNVVSTSEISLKPYFTVTPLGVETSTQYSNPIVIPISGNLKEHFENSKETGMINVYNDKAYNAGKEFSVTITLRKLIASNQITIFNTVPNKYNLDLFATFFTRDREVHMKGAVPSIEFNRDYFNKVGQTDFSTKDNYIWALMIPKEIKHPIETVNIETAYPQFKLWVTSNGKTNSDWYNYPNTKACYTKE